MVNLNTLKYRPAHVKRNTMESRNTELLMKVFLSCFEIIPVLVLCWSKALINPSPIVYENQTGDITTALI